MIKVSVVEFSNFVRKLKGSLVFNGNMSRANKLFDNLLYKLKRTFNNIDPFVVLYKVFSNLVPVFAVRYIKLGARYQQVPKLAIGNFRIVMVITWLLRSTKNKFNIRGFKFEEFVKNIVDAYYNKGRAKKNKELFYKHVLSGKQYLTTLLSSEDVVVEHMIRNRLRKKLDEKKKKRIKYK